MSQCTLTFWLSTAARFIPHLKVVFRYNSQVDFSATSKIAPNCETPGSRISPSDKYTRAQAKNSLTIWKITIFRWWLHHLVSVNNVHALRSSRRESSLCNVNLSSLESQEHYCFSFWNARNRKCRTFIISRLRLQSRMNESDSEGCLQTTRAGSYHFDIGKNNTSVCFSVLSMAEDDYSSRVSLICDGPLLCKKRRYAE